MHCHEIICFLILPTTSMDKKETKYDEDKDFPFEIEPVLNYIGPKARWQYFQSFKK